MSDSEEELTESLLKLIFVGEPNVGKTSIIRRFCYDEFTRQYNQTVGADFFMKRLVLPGRKDISIRITDIGGLERNGHMLGNYVFNSNMIILVYDITNAASFEGMLLWINSITKFVDKPMFVAIFGNKCDLEHKRAVRLDKTQSFVEELQIFNFLISAKTGENVNTCLTDLIAKHFGISLSRIEREKHKTILKAELKATPPEQIKNNPATPSSSSVCCVQ